MNNKKVIQCIIRDITDRKRIEEALTFAEMRYHHLLNQKRGNLLLMP
jgi:two-component system CheB/CheR fusion protein